MIGEWLEIAVRWSVSVVDYLGYQGVILLMFLESSFVPFPSELVMPQAGYLASQGKMDLGLAIFMGILGSWLGALLNYYLALRLGRPFFVKFGKYLFCPPETFAKVENFFREHGEIGTFTGRLIPVVRQYISLPAGLAGMNMFRFLFYTGLGSGIWVAILAYIGYVAGYNEALVKKYSREWTVWVVAGCVLLVAAYVWWYRRRKQRSAVPCDRPPAQ
jgi:membrane protein DedA with SNARE-associated domain